MNIKYLNIIVNSYFIKSYSKFTKIFNGNFFIIIFGIDDRYTHLLFGILPKVISFDYNNILNRNGDTDIIMKLNFFFTIIIEKCKLKKLKEIFLKKLYALIVHDYLLKIEMHHS